MISALPFQIQNGLNQPLPSTAPTIAPQVGPLGIAKSPIVANPIATPQASPFTPAKKVPYNQSAEYKAQLKAMPPAQLQAALVNQGGGGVAPIVAPMAATGVAGGGDFKAQYQAILNSLPNTQSQINPQLTSLISQLQQSFNNGNDSATINAALGAQRAAAYGELNNQALLDAAARGMTLGGGDYGKLYSELQAPIERQLAAGAADAQLQALQRKQNGGVQLAQLLSGLQSDEQRAAAQRQSMALDLFQAQQNAGFRSQEIAMEQQRFAAQQQAARQAVEYSDRAQVNSGPTGAQKEAADWAARSAALQQSLRNQALATAQNQAMFASAQPPAGPFVGNMNGATAAMTGSFLSAGSGSGIESFQSYTNRQAQNASAKGAAGETMNYEEANRRNSLGLPTGAVSRNSMSGSRAADNPLPGSTQIAASNFPAFQAMYPPTNNGRNLM